MAVGIRLKLAGGTADQIDRLMRRSTRTAVPRMD